MSGFVWIGSNFLVRVPLIGKSGFRFWNPDFGFAIERKIRKRIFNAENSGLARARIINKKNTAVHENSLANPFSDFAVERQKGNPWNPDLDFLIEIHPGDRFLGGGIRFRISCSFAKSEIRKFPNRTQGRGFNWICYRRVTMVLHFAFMSEVLFDNSEVSFIGIV